MAADGGGRQVVCMEACMISCRPVTAPCAPRRRVQHRLTAWVTERPGCVGRAGVDRHVDVLALTLTAHTDGRTHKRFIVHTVVQFMEPNHIQRHARRAANHSTRYSSLEYSRPARKPIPGHSVTLLRRSIVNTAVDATRYTLYETIRQGMFNMR